MALFDAVAEWLAVPYLLDRYAGAPPQRVGLAHPGICPYGVFTSNDGVQFVLSIQNEGEWQRLCGIGLEQPKLAEDDRCANNETRVANRAFVDGAVQSVVGELSYLIVQQRFDAADLAFAPLRAISQLKDHPDYHTFDVLVDGQTVALPVVPGRQRPDNQNVPTLGEHTEEVLGRT